MTAGKVNGMFGSIQKRLEKHRTELKEKRKREEMEARERWRKIYNNLVGVEVIDENFQERPEGEVRRDEDKLMLQKHKKGEISDYQMFCHLIVGICKDHKVGVSITKKNEGTLIIDMSDIKCKYGMNFISTNKFESITASLRNINCQVVAYGRQDRGPCVIVKIPSSDDE
ncbi:hypothetical protein [Azospirillum baldaniorum]|uniref:hypothetical protein n=1 Tax=Azospirillum baldaniorum TaxID=1064539 RepID=UPI00119C9F31|nr:hypothetical protein [Azospirillum baldaniorum]